MLRLTSCIARGGVVFKTAEEAIAVADEIISKCKERMKTNG